MKDFDANKRRCTETETRFPDGRVERKTEMKPWEYLASVLIKVFGEVVKRK